MITIEASATQSEKFLSILNDGTEIFFLSI